MELVADMTFPHMTETDDSWQILTADAEVTRVSFDRAVTLLTASADASLEVRIENEFSITASDGSTTCVNSEGETSQLSPALPARQWRTHAGYAPETTAETSSTRER
ncbi:hypothetical protein K378_01073 [Streptomyces sp. Amel2xB2]|nr:hypothetical protein K378_01073 [Streptomyces sp. Amel2xB2]